MIDIIEILQPETELERRLIIDLPFIQGVMYGKERSGHPEGTVIYHIREVLKNINKYSKNSEQREKLRLIAFIHDTFKYLVDYNQHRVGDNHHSRKACEYAKNFITDPDVLQVIRYHDDAYNIWKRGNRRNELDKSEKELLKFISKINDLDLYFTFYRCDNETGDKTQDDLIWANEILKNK